MASKLHCGNYLPKQIPIFLQQTHFHLLHCNLPKNSVPTPFIISSKFQQLTCLFFATAPFTMAQPFPVTVSELPQKHLLCPHPQGMGVGRGRKVCRPETHLGYLLGILVWDSSTGIPQSHTSRTTAPSLVSSKSNSASLTQAHLTSQIKCSL